MIYYYYAKQTTKTNIKFTHQTQAEVGEKVLGIQLVLSCAPPAAAAAAASCCWLLLLMLLQEQLTVDAAGSSSSKRHPLRVMLNAPESCQIV